MTAIDPGMPESRTIGDDATATAPRTVNGLTVRPREKVNLWGYGVCFLPVLPDFVLLSVIIGLGLHRLLRYLDTNIKRRAP
jgi:hypothetical protein